MFLLIPPWVISWHRPHLVVCFHVFHQLGSPGKHFITERAAMRILREGHPTSVVHKFVASTASLSNLKRDLLCVERSLLAQVQILPTTHVHLLWFFIDYKVKSRKSYFDVDLQHLLDLDLVLNLKPVWPLLYPDPLWPLLDPDNDRVLDLNHDCYLFCYIW